MKTINTKLIVALFTTLVLTGCMPDSLTKFKKDAPKKAATVAVEVTPPITDGNGNAVDPDTLTFPTKFYFGTEGVVADVALQINETESFTGKSDGTLADPAKRNILFLKCELVDTGPVITQTLPPGLSLNESTCEVSGTPTTIYSDTTPGNVGGKITYTVRMTYKGADGVATEPNCVSQEYTGVGTESYCLASFLLSVNDVPAGLDMTQNEKLQVKLQVKGGALVSNIQTNTNPLVNYNRYGVLSSNKSITGIVKYVDSASSTIGVNRIQPLVVADVNPFSVNGFVSTAPPVPNPLGLDYTKSGKILSKNLATNTIYVESLTGSAFVVGDALDYDIAQVPFVVADSTVTAISSSYKFPIAAKVDNDSQYFTEKFNIERITQTYERGVPIQPISPIPNSTILEANGIIYGISPALPDGLSFSTTTGIISGTFTNTLDSTEFVITAYNDLGESTYSLFLAAIDSPKDLSYTSNQLITVNSNVPFLEGESLFQPLAPPLTSSVQGKILRKVSDNLLSIETLNGLFPAEASLDSGNAYYSEKNYITLASNPNHFSVALTVTDATNFAVGDYIGSSTGAKGRVVYSDTSDPANHVLYVQFLTPNVVSSAPAGAIVNTFTAGSTLDDVYPHVAPEATINQVEAANMELTLDDRSGFDPGNDFTSSANISGYIYDWDDVLPNVIKVNEINRTGTVGSHYLRAGQNLDPSEFYLVADAAISGVTHDNLIVVERGVSRIIHANVSQGTSIIYSISPALPPGLTLNVATGVISGTPTAMSPRKSYVVTATNLLDKAYYAFSLEVRDHFTFSEASGAKSFLTHKIGDSRSNRPCRINTADILNDNSAALDIGCNLEAEELELFYSKLKLTASVGGGACEYIGFKPYSFWQYSPIQSAKTIDYAATCTGVAGAVTTLPAPTSADDCDGNYTNRGGPNCDSGTVTVTTHTASTGVIGDPCDTAVDTAVVACAGVKTSCLAGPVTTFMSPAELISGYRSQTVAASTGASKTWELQSSVEFLDITNLRNANGVVRNACSDTRAAANTWANQAGIAATASPFAEESPYYEFTCLDAAKDIKARIRLTVRDWNRTFKITDIYDLTPSIPLSTVLMPKKMNDSTAPVFGTSYNNVRDWDDDYTGTGAASFAACGANPMPAPGSCSGGGHLTEATCVGAGQLWTPPKAAYKYPEDNI